MKKARTNDIILSGNTAARGFERRAARGATGIKGILCVNHFLNGAKFRELHLHLIESAEKCGIRLELFTNLQLQLDLPRADFVLFWDKDIPLAMRLESAGLPVFNSAKSIALCDDKAKTYAALEGRFAQPETMIAPLTYFESDLSAFVSAAVKRLGLPLVFKECCGSFGEQVWLCRTKEDIMGRISAKPFILQKFISRSAGRDVRIEVVGERVAAAVRRINENDFRANVTGGGRMESYEPTEQEARLAVSACKALGLTFGGVDILEGGLLCEVNSNAHIINIMNATGVDTAPLIFDEIRSRL